MEGSLAPSDAGTCPEGSFLGYRSPGCGDEAPPLSCVPQPDGCAALACSCEGKEIIGCGWYESTYRVLGSCDPLLNDAAVVDGAYPSTQKEVCAARGGECEAVARACDLVEEAAVADCNRPPGEGREGVRCAVEAAGRSDPFFLAGAGRAFFGRAAEGGFEVVEVSHVSPGEVWPGAVRWRVCASLDARANCSGTDCVDCGGMEPWETLCEP